MSEAMNSVPSVVVVVVVSPMTLSRTSTTLLDLDAILICVYVQPSGSGAVPREKVFVSSFVRGYC